MNQVDEQGPLLRRGLKSLFVLATVVVSGVVLVNTAEHLGRKVGEMYSETSTTQLIDVIPGRSVTVDIPAGSSANLIGDLLQEAGVIRSSTQFAATVRAEGVESSLRAGVYDMETGMSNDDVIVILRQGPVERTFRVTVVEGLRVQEMLKVLSDSAGIPVEEFETALLDGSVTTTLRSFDEEMSITDWEGILFPDTYEFSDRSTAVSILQRMSDTMTGRVESVDWTRFESLGYSKYEGVIIASLIESEVRVSEERPLVSSVIQNRLSDDERLDIDATVLYALGSRDPNAIDVSYDSPYNTRKYKGLPPTPICGPSLASLEAAADPADTDFKYYVLAGEDGHHKFSVTLEEHNAAVEEARAAGLLG